MALKATHLYRITKGGCRRVHSLPSVAARVIPRRGPGGFEPAAAPGRELPAEEAADAPRRQSRADEPRAGSRHCPRSAGGSPAGLGPVPGCGGRARGGGRAGRAAFCPPWARSGAGPGLRGCGSRRSSGPGAEQAGTAAPFPRRRRKGGGIRDPAVGRRRAGRLRG